MAKRPTHAPPQTQDEEMVVTVVRFRGSGETLRKGIDAVTQALAGAFGPATVTKVIGNGKKPVQALGSGEVLESADEDVDQGDDGSNEGEEQGEQVVPPKPKRDAGKPKYSFLPDFNLAPDGVPSLKEFCAGKTVQGEQDRYLIVSLWLQRHGGADPFTGNHLFTCLRALDWKGRLDVSQPVREMKSRKSWYDSPSYGKWRLTQPGVEAAEAVGKE